jgi:ubiquinone biosynthesis monooxygenase Coq6
MSAVDKLHKLYSTTAAPVVWARSVGLEVVNELDTLKAAFMLSAGARTDVRRTAGSTGWALAAKGVEGAADVLGGARMVGGVLRGLVGAGMQELGNRMSGRRPQ